jgi:uncharacterized membrane protein YheB (UPF0754 family)
MSFEVLIPLTLPVVTAGIGWITNWIAVKMLFWPEARVELFRVGWQGVIYRNHRDMAEKISRIASEDILTPSGVLERVNVSELEPIFAADVERYAPSIIDEVLRTLGLATWEELDRESQDALIIHAKREVRLALLEALERFGRYADQWLNFQELAVETLSENGGRTLARVVKEFGQREIGFLIWFGALFGFLIGLIEAALWLAFGVWWLLPLLGLIVGGTTNWAAIQMIFYPRDPLRVVGGFEFQGLLPKHQSELSAQFAAIAGRDVLSARAIVEHISQGELTERVQVMIREVFDDLWEEQAFMLRFVAPDIRAEKLDQAKEILVTRLIDAFEENRDQFEAQLDQALSISDRIREQLERLPKQEIEQLFRGVTQRDEPTLIGIGVVLGGIIGLVQAMVLSAL